jgi:predicted nicotinamide N-methyase
LFEEIEREKENQTQEFFFGANKELRVTIHAGQYDQIETGWKLWDAAVILSRFLFENASLVKDKRVLELGSGCGLVGIVCGHLTRELVFSDYVPTVSLFVWLKKKEKKEKYFVD